MAEKLMIQSIVTDNRITAAFSDKELPRYARHGELYVVDGILFIYADLDSSNHGRWFPLTDRKEIFTYEKVDASEIWSIPIDFQTDNIQIIIYDQNDKIYVKNFTVDVDENQIEIVFEEAVSGQCYIVINKAFDWVDRRFIVADRNFAVTEDENNPNDYFIEVDTNYVEILKNGNTTLRKDLDVKGSFNVEGATTFTGDQTLGGSVDIGGNLSVQGTVTIVNKFIADFDAEIKGNLNVDTNLVVDGITTLNNDVTVDANETITGNLSVGGNQTINGDLTVKGTTTTIQTEEIKLDDNIVTLNANAVGTPTQNAGIEVERGDETKTTIVQWDETNDVTNIPNNTTINGTVSIDSDVTVGGNQTIHGDLQIDGNTNIDGNVTIKGENVDIQTTTLTVEDNIITINKGFSGIPTDDAGLEIDRGDEGVLALVTFDETNDKVTIPVKQQNGSFLQDEVSGKIFTLDEINKEKVRAISQETILANDITDLQNTSNDSIDDLQTQIDNEKSARISSDNTIQSNIDTETTRATNVEDTIRTDLNTEISERETDVNTLTTQLSDESDARTNSDATLQSSINTEKARAESIELDLQSSITDETTRAKTVEGDLTNLTTDDKTNLVNAVNEEISRAKLSETNISTDLSSETTNRTSADTSLQGNIDNEIDARISGDTNLQGLITTEKTDRTDADTTLQNNIDTETTRATNVESTLNTKFDDYISNKTTNEQELNSDLTINESVVIKKDLTVEGTTTTVNATSIDVDDNKLILNSNVTTGAPTQDGSILIRRGDEGEQTVIKWYENGNQSNIQISEWDLGTSQFVNKTVATQNYVDGEISTLNSSLDLRVSTLENDTTTDTLTTDLDNEISRAKSVEGDLANLSTSVTTNIVSAVNSEVSRATNSETTLTSSLNDEISRAVDFDNQIGIDLDNEIDRATSAETTLTDGLTNEITRATTVEGDISTLSTNDKTDLTKAINSLKSEIDTNATSTSTTIDSMFVKSGDDIVFKGNLVPETDSILNIGSPDKKIGEVYVSSNTIYLGENTIISESGLALNGSLNASEINVTNITADNIYDKSTVDTKLDGVETELAATITDLETAHNTLVQTVSDDSLSKGQTTPQSVTGEVSFATNVTIEGDLNIIGDQNVTNVVTLAVENNEIILNDGTTDTPYLDGIISVDRGTSGIQPILTWQELGVNSSVKIPYIDGEGNIIQDTIVTMDTLDNKIIEMNTDSETLINDEVTRATSKEEQIETTITNEISRAISTEGLLTGLSNKLQDNDGNLPTSLVSAINKVVSNTTTSESGITTTISNEITRATQSENDLSSSIVSETSRATSKENSLENSIDSEISRATSAENTINTALTTEKSRAQSKENEITSDLASEITRATDIENGLQTQLDSISSAMSSDAERLAAIQNVTTAFENADSDLNNAITDLSNSATTKLNDEITARTNANITITSNLTAEIDRAKDVEGQLIALDTDTQSNLVNAINEVHTDVDTEKSRAETSETTLQSNIDSEESARIAADNTLTTNLNNEITARTNADNDLQSNIDSEESARIATDNTLTTNLSNEITRAKDSESTLQTNIDSEESARIAADNTLTTNLNDEITRAKDSESTLQTNIDNEKSRIDAILSSSDADKDSFAEIVTLINSVDTTNDESFAGYVSSNDVRSSTIESSVTDEITRAKDSESTLQTNIDSEESARIAADNTLTTNLNDEITRAKSSESTLTTNLSNEITRAKDSENTLQTNIDSEESARIAADNTLQTNIDNEKSRIDAILSSSDADKDSFAEIVTLINSVDTTNDESFAGYVSSNDARSSAIETNLSNHQTASDNKFLHYRGNIDAGDEDTVGAQGIYSVSYSGYSGMMVNLTGSGSTSNIQLNAEYDGDALYYRISRDSTTNWDGVGKYDQRIYADHYHPEADTLTTARTIAFGGDLSGSASFDGSSNITITATVADDSHNHTISNVDGLQEALDNKLGLTSKAADSDKLDGYNSATASTASTVVIRDSSSDITARLFRSEYDTTNSSIGYIMTQVNTDDDNYIRPSTISQVQTALGVDNLDYLPLSGGTVTGDVTINGTMSATSIVETSSIRFKENVKPIENAFEKVSQLQGVTYDWKKSGKSDIGFIAEEVDKVIPELVEKSEDGTVEGMNYSKLTSMLVEVVKDQQKQIDELKKLIK